jgi:hypothetical protein
MGIRERLGAPKTGDWLGIVKFDCLAGRFWKVDKDSLGQPLLTDILAKPIAIDWGSAEYGWMKFGAVGPVRHMAPYGSSPTPMPDEVDAAGRSTFKPGFYLKVCGAAVDGVREWCSTTATLIDVIDKAWEEYEAAPEAARGQIPLVVVTASAPVVKGSGTRRQTTYAPTIRITSWVDRPAVLGARTVPLPSGASQEAPAQPQPAQQAPVQQPPPPASLLQQVAAHAAAASLPADEMPF